MNAASGGGLFGLVVPEDGDNHLQLQEQIPDDISNFSSGGVGNGSNTSGWSLVVETNGGTSPAARSLHAAAILNGVMYVCKYSVLV
jgi:hypothetical protein